MMDAGITGKSGKAVGVLCHADGTVTVALLGTEQVVGGLIERLKGLLPANFRFAPPHVDLPNLKKAKLPDGSLFEGGIHCAEPKLFAAARSVASPVQEMAILWRGKGPNPYPLGSGSKWMAPCWNCRILENIKMFIAGE